MSRSLVNLDGLRDQLQAVVYEASKYGTSKALRDRLVLAHSTLDVIEAEREKRS